MVDELFIELWGLFDLAFGRFEAPVDRLLAVLVALDQPPSQGVLVGRQHEDE